MNDRPIVGILAAATKDHLLIEVALHIALCGKNPKGKVLCEHYKDGASIDSVLTMWEQSTRQCSWCAKRFKKRHHT